MFNPADLKTKIFLDSGQVAETRQALNLLGFLDGQTTNPSLIAKNFQAGSSSKISENELLAFYRGQIEEITGLMPQGSISVEVYADSQTPAEQMVSQGLEMFNWSPNAYIKLPITKAGLEAAEELIRQGIRVNLTLCFSQEQAAAVASMAKNAQAGQVYISPFIGRLDDQGLNGLSLIRNILKMYRQQSAGVLVLAASLRNLGHLQQCFRLETDIITAPFKVLSAWAEAGFSLSDEEIENNHQLKDLPYQEFDLLRPWQDFSLEHELTNRGLQQFADDWNALIK